MAKATKEVAVAPEKNALPAHLAQYQKQAIGNIDRTDLVVPRIKLLQGTSPELDEFPETARKGQFWHSVLAEPLGAKLMGVPIVVRKSYVLWAPRNDDRGILARARDGVHWDQPGAEFSFIPKGTDKQVTYKLARTVVESGLAEFGSSIPGNPNSVPAASLTYDTLWFFPELEQVGPAIIINTRSSIKPMQTLLSKIDAKPVPHFVQLYEIGSTVVQGNDGPYYNYTYTGAGFADQETCEITSAMYDRFKEADWAANDEGDDAPESGGAAKGGKPITEADQQKY
jgi:hypothetical protein